MSQQTNQSKELNYWVVYGICLLISTIFFFLFGFNSPIYLFNSDNDYNCFMTVGHSFVNGKLPYRDLFEHKGPIVYFVFAFCCLFSNPSIVILILEIISMSLFFFFAYRICKKRLNTFWSLVAIPLLAFAVFTSWCRTRSAATVEEFCLPIYTYFLLCWLEFLMDKRHWNWVRSLCLGLCFGVLLWVKYTLFYFMVVPMIIWFILSLRRRQYRTLIINILCMLGGILIITAPNLIFYAAHNALDDLFHVYFVINLTAYGTTDPLVVLISFGLFFCIGPVVLFLMLFGVIRFAIRFWHERSGWLLLTSFLITLALLVYSCKEITYYYTALIPYAVLGLTDILNWLSNKFTLSKYKTWIYLAITIICIAITAPCSIYIYELGRNRDEYAPLAIADTIKDYEAKTNQDTTLLCYRVGDFGFYNATNKIPNNYFFMNNLFEKDRLPEMHESFQNHVINQSSDFIITSRNIWEKEKDFLDDYYQPYKDGDIEASTFHYKNKVHYFYYLNYDFVLLIKK